MPEAELSNTTTQADKSGPTARTKRRRQKAKDLAALGYPAPKLSDAYRGRQLLNADTIAGMHEAFRVGGREAIFKVMKQQPAIFLKLLVLLVPRELQIEHRGGVKGMTENQIIDAIEAIEAFLARRRGDSAKVIEDVGTDVGRAVAVADNPTISKDDGG